MSAVAFSALGLAPDLDLHLARIGAGLLLCSFAALAAALFLRRHPGLIRAPRLGRAHMKPGVQVIESRRLSQHADVCRFACAGKEYLVIVSAGHALVVRESEAPSGQADKALP